MGYNYKDDYESNGCKFRAWREGIHKIDDNYSLEMRFHEGWIIKVLKDEEKIMYFHKPSDGVAVNKERVFTARNFIKYYTWKMKQRIFWYCSARNYNKISSHIRRKWKLNDTPYTCE